jgi:group I intron endonuclease
MAKGVIYVITNIVNSKQYIGQAVNNLSNGREWGSKKRFQKHLYEARTNKCSCRLLENAIRKYGEHNFLVEDLTEVEISKLNLMEKKFIEEHNTLSPNGYNLMTGGSNGRLHSTETKLLMSSTRTGKKHSETTKEKIGEAHLGKKLNGNTKEKIGKSSKYRNMSFDNKTKITSALKKLDLTELPMYICFSVHNRKGKKIERVSVRIPNYKYKSFSSLQLDLSTKISLAIDYKTLLLNGHRSEESSQLQ